jgi:hypothetical protein
MKPHCSMLFMSATNLRKMNRLFASDVDIGDWG